MLLLTMVTTSCTLNKYIMIYTVLYCHCDCDRYYTCNLDGIQLYMVLDGHNGSRACEFALKRIPSLLLQYNMGDNGENAAEALKHTFVNTEKHFFMMLDPSITRKMGLQMQIQVMKGGR